jgi:hypothetical protein
VSPGKLTVSVAVPHPLPQQLPFDDYNALATAIVVPRLDDLPAGAFDLATLDVGINAPDHHFNLAAPGMSSIEIDVPPLTEGQVETTYRVVGRYTDTVGSPSDDAEVFFTVRNFRSPVILDAGIGLIWTSDPGPSPEVEVKLKWPSAAGNQYRVYLADQAGMGITPAELADEGPVPSRGHIAKVGATKPGDRKQFRLLTDPPVIAAGSTTVFTATLPRSLETVQFLRVVPLGSDGDEAEFDKCGIVPVAVPESRRPPPPQVDASVDPATGYATLHISTDGADRSILERDEPGLFNPGEAGNEPPRAILRRAVAGVADPIYARRIVKEPVAMTLDPATGRYVAKIEDNNGDRGLEPYVNYVYWAEWQMPPERRLPAKVTEIHVGEIEAVDPSSIRDRPRPFSPPSAPRVVTYVPAAGPRAPVPEDVVVSIEASPAPDTVTVALKLAEPPSTHKLAAERYRLTIWTQWLNKPIEVIKNANGTELSASWPEIESGEVATVIAKDLENNGLMLRLAMVDPVGRMSTITLKPA